MSIPSSWGNPYGYENVCEYDDEYSDEYDDQDYDNEDQYYDDYDDDDGEHDMMDQSLDGHSYGGFDPRLVGRQMQRPDLATARAPTMNPARNRMDSMRRIAMQSGARTPETRMTGVDPRAMASMRAGGSLGAPFSNSRLMAARSNREMLNPRMMSSFSSSPVQRMPVLTPSPQRGGMKGTGMRMDPSLSMAAGRLNYSQSRVGSPVMRQTMMRRGTPGILMRGGLPGGARRGMMMGGAPGRSIGGGIPGRTMGGLSMMRSRRR